MYSAYISNFIKYIEIATSSFHKKHNKIHKIKLIKEEKKEAFSVELFKNPKTKDG